MRKNKNRMDLSGQRFRKWVVIREDEPKGYERYWLCRCDCGTERPVRQASLRRKRNGTISCGCHKREVTTGLAKKTIKDGVKIPNLRMKVRADSGTGVKGVQFYKGKYNASISLRGKLYYLGRYDTMEEAKAARKRGEEKYHKPHLD